MRPGLPGYASGNTESNQASEKILIPFLLFMSIDAVRAMFPFGYATAVYCRSAGWFNCYHVHVCTVDYLGEAKHTYQFLPFPF